jgi:ribA/ribD-fused uncharacterized protein
MRAFFGGQSLFSNFHKAKFKVGQVWYESSEQYYQKVKSEFVGDDEAGIRIMSTSNPFEAYKIGQQLNAKTDIQAWHNEPAIKIMEKGIMDKFEQNIHLKTFLLNTGKMTLVEANPREHFWGAGVSLKDHAKLMDILNWPGKNELGKMLERIRLAFSTSYQII